MKIENWAILMTSSHSSFQSLTREESLRTWTGDEIPETQDQSPGELFSGARAVILELSEQARAMLEQAQKPAEAKPPDDLTFEISQEDKIKMLLIESMVKSLTGKDFKFYMVEKIDLSGDKVKLENTIREASGAPRRRGWGLEYNYSRSYYEMERLSFSAQGLIRTADGREINFSVQLNMSREFAATNNISIRAGDAAKDPLVINFDGTAPGLTEAKYSFDLDSDGREELISFVRPGSGFLALDLNGDCRVNDGRELFGPATGDGFAELARYDQDGNRWIDENDAIFSRLRIWAKDAQGNDLVVALGQKGVGAIYLGNITAAFDLKDQGNNLLGQAKSAGVFINENGSVGTVQQIDLVV